MDRVRDLPTALTLVIWGKLSEQPRQFPGRLWDKRIYMAGAIIEYRRGAESKAKVSAPLTVDEKQSCSDVVRARFPPTPKRATV